MFTSKFHSTILAEINSGDTAWLIVSAALVLFMMMPGLALFYAGLVRKKNTLSIFMQCFALTCVLSIVWLVCGYTLSFTSGNAVVGGLGKVFLNGVGQVPCTIWPRRCRSSVSLHSR
jgi:Amt family ammonium transporter